MTTENRKRPRSEAQRQARLEALRAKIDNEEYLRGAIEGMALKVSDGLLDIPQGGLNYEQRQWTRRREP